MCLCIQLSCELNHSSQLNAPTASRETLHFPSSYLVNEFLTFKKSDQDLSGFSMFIVSDILFFLILHSLLVHHVTSQTYKKHEIYTGYEKDCYNELKENKPNKIYVIADPYNKNCFILCKTKDYSRIVAKKHCCNDMFSTNKRKNGFYCSSIQKCCVHGKDLKYNDEYCNPSNYDNKLEVKKMGRKCPTYTYPGTVTTRCAIFNEYRTNLVNMQQLTSKSRISTFVYAAGVDYEVGQKVKLEVMAYGYNSQDKKGYYNTCPIGDKEVYESYDKKKEKYNRIVFYAKTNLTKQAQRRLYLSGNLKDLTGRSIRITVGTDVMCCTIRQVKQPLYDSTELKNLGINIFSPEPREKNEKELNETRYTKGRDYAPKNIPKSSVNNLHHPFGKEDVNKYRTQKVDRPSFYGKNKERYVKPKNFFSSRKTSSYRKDPYERSYEPELAAFNQRKENFDDRKEETKGQKSYMRRKDFPRRYRDKDNVQKNHYKERYKIY